jgi:ABC-type glycerol-3-phosphate transport system permease component
MAARRHRVGGVGVMIGLAFLGLWTLAVLLPFAWTVLTAFKTEREMRSAPFDWPVALGGGQTERGVFDNFSQAWDKLDFELYFRNSVTVVGVSLILILLVAAPAAYALARLKLPGRRVLLLYLMTGLMIPAQLILVPLFFQYNTWSAWLTAGLEGPLRLVGYQAPEVSLHDSFPGLILIYVATSLSFSVFVLTNFFRSLPTELYEAGIIDGCSEWQAYWHVMLPMARSGLITVAIFNFIWLWNEYLFALVFIQDASRRTLPLGLAALSIQAGYRSGGRVDAGVLFAGLVIVMLPTLVVFLLLQRRLVRGITIGAVKG